jgi:hypothetical protein
MELIADAPAVASGAHGDPKSAIPPDGDFLPSLGNQFAQLGPPFFSRVTAAPLPEPYLVAASDETARLLGIDPAALESPPWLAALSGNQVLPDSTPLAAVYSGHQFGVWAGQLGDGRALLLGDVAVGSTRFELQLKGAGVDALFTHGRWPRGAAFFDTRVSVFRSHGRARNTDHARARGGGL